MAYEAITAAECAQDEPITTDLMLKIKGNFDYLYSLIGSGGGGSSGGGGGGVPNGSFELDEDGDNIPDTWTRYLYPGGSAAYETANPMHGAKGYKFTRAAGTNNGGGYLESDYITCNEFWIGKIAVNYYCSVPGIKVIVQIRYYDRTKYELIGSPITLYTSTNNPTVRSRIVVGTVPIVGARYFKIRLIGGYTDTDVAGSVVFDGVELVQPDLIYQAPLIEVPLQYSGSGWVDAGGISTYFPYGVSRFKYSGRLVANNNDTMVGVRLRIGTLYSDIDPAIGIYYPVWSNVTNYINCQSLQGTYGTITIQLYNSNPGRTVSYDKAAYDANNFIG